MWQQAINEAASKRGFRKSEESGRGGQLNKPNVDRDWKA